jgi:hypothetical protein
MIEKPIIQKLATKYNLPLKVVEQIVFHQFKYVAKIMKEGNFESVRLPYFGKFWVKPGRIKHLDKRTENKKRRLADEELN